MTNPKKTAASALIVCLIAFLAPTTWTHAQTVKPYVGELAEIACECISALPESLDASAYRQQAEGCFAEALLAKSEVVRKDYDFSNNEEMTKLGEQIGLKMAGICPDVLMKYERKYNGREDTIDKEVTINEVTVGRSFFDYVQIVDIYNTDYTTAVKLRFKPQNAINGTLHAPDGEYPYILSDKRGNRYALKYQEGWGGPDNNGFGTIPLKAGTVKDVVLHFNKVGQVEDVYSLTELDCGQASSSNCWDFYDIKVILRQ
jgi:hypothetical protein